MFSSFYEVRNHRAHFSLAAKLSFNLKPTGSSIAENPEKLWETMRWSKQDLRRKLLLVLQKPLRALRHTMAIRRAKQWKQLIKLLNNRLILSRLPSAVIGCRPRDCGYVVEEDREDSQVSFFLVERAPLKPKALTRSLNQRPKPKCIRSSIRETNDV